MRPYQKQVESGIQILDSHFSEWRGWIDRKRLNLRNPSHCIIGQIGEHEGNGYITQMFAIKSKSYDDGLLQFPYDHGFDLKEEIPSEEYKELQKEWERHLKD